MILPRTQHLQRYPRSRTEKPLMGIETYGRESVNGILCHKIGYREADRVEALGYHIVKRGTGYVYVI